MKHTARVFVNGNNERKEITYIITKLFEKVEGLSVYSFDGEKKFFNQNITNETIIEGIDTFIGGDLETDKKCVFLYNYEMFGSNFNHTLRDYLEKFKNIHFIIAVNDKDDNVIPQHIRSRMTGLNFSNSADFDKSFLYLAFNINPENIVFDIYRNFHLIKGKRLIVIDGFVETEIHEKFRQNLIKKYYNQQQYETYHADLSFEGEINLNELRAFLITKTYYKGIKKCVILSGLNTCNSKFRLEAVAYLVEQYYDVDFIFITEIEKENLFIPTNHPFQIYKLDYSENYQLEESYSKISEILNF